MKHNWSYKKLGEVANIHDTLRKPVTKKDRRAGVYPYYGATGIQDYVDNYIFDGRYVLVGEDGAKWGANEKSAYIIEGKSWVNNHAHVLSFTSDVCDSFVAYYLNYKDLDSFISGAIVRKLTQKSLLSIPLPCPSLDEQQAIVRELDGINHLIDLQEEQLREYDRLAQSLFYTTFGDPIVNNKGWSCKKFSEAFKLKSGDGLPTNLFIDGPYPVYGGNGISGMHNTYNMDGDYIIIGRVGVYCGNVRHVIGKFWLTDNAFRLFYDNENNNSIFITSMLTYLNLNQYANQAAQPVISNITLKDVSVIVPPLALQQTFAVQIEAIEQQKALIRRSLDDIRTLLAARMQYYFE